MGAPFDIDIPAPPRTTSATNIVVPITIVSVVLIQTVLISVWLGGHAEKWDAAADTVKEIKAAQYTQTDAAKDLALVRSEVAELQRRVEMLEAAHQQAESAAAKLRRLCPGAACPSR